MKVNSSMIECGYGGEDRQFERIWGKGDVELTKEMLHRLIKEHISLNYFAREILPRAKFDQLEDEVDAMEKIKHKEEEPFYEAYREYTRPTYEAYEKAQKEASKVLNKQLEPIKEATDKERIELYWKALEPYIKIG